MLPTSPLTRPPPPLPSQILAPTNDAFAALLTNLAGPGSKKKLAIDDLLKLPEAKNILTYHVLPGNYSTGEGGLALTVLCLCSGLSCWL